jgi:hypothetical protein
MSPILPAGLLRRFLALSRVCAFESATDRVSGGLGERTVWIITVRRLDDPACRVTATGADFVDAMTEAVRLAESNGWHAP